MIVLGIDQSYNSSGIVVLRDDDLIHFECYKSNKEQNRFGQAYEIAMYIGTLIDIYNPDYVGIEGLAYGIRGNILIDLAGLQYAIIIHLQEIKKYQVQIVSPTQLKKFSTGSGKASKADMIASVPDYILNEFKDKNYKKTTGLSDLADSYNISKWVESENKGKINDRHPNF